jgi:YegS/Rv2252/BmrU family lipid kinase
MRALLIGNPSAGVGKTTRTIERFCEILTDLGHQVDRRITSKSGDAREWASTIAPEFDRIIVAGGDGTVNEVVNGLKAPHRIPLLHLATGTANMLSRDLGLPSNLKDLAHLLQNGQVVYSPLGLVGEKRFLLILSAGFDASVVEYISKSRSGALGYLGYAAPIVKAALNYRPTPMRIIVDESSELVGESVMGLRVRHYGGYFIFSEHARLDSQFFEILVLHEAGIMRIIKYALAALARRTSHLKGLSAIAGATFRIESDEPVAVQADGDYWGKTPVTVRMSPDCLALIKPPEK